MEKCLSIYSDESGVTGPSIDTHCQAEYYIVVQNIVSVIKIANLY